MSENILKSKDQWLTPDLMQKLLAKPHLLAAFQDPQFSAVLAELQKNPQVAMQKYGSNAKFREFIMEFSNLMGSHFDEVADKKAKEEEEKKRKEEEMMKNDPVYKIIQTDPQVKAALEDPKVTAVIQKLQVQGGLDFNEVARSDPATAQKLMLLINKGVLNTQS